MGRWIDAEGGETEGPLVSTELGLIACPSSPLHHFVVPLPTCGEESGYSFGFFGVVAAPATAPMTPPATVAPVLPPIA